MSIKQAAILRLKNIIKSYWSIRNGEASRISEGDRKIIKDNILEAMIWQKIPAIRVQLVECLYLIIRGDFPENWPDLLPSIMKNFESQDPTRIHGACSALQQVFKKFQFKPDSDRQELVAHTFPMLQQLMGALVNQNTPRAFDLIRSITKIFFMSMQVSTTGGLARMGRLIEQLSLPLRSDGK